jgi:DNA modification methylase
MFIRFLSLTRLAYAVTHSQQLRWSLRHELLPVFKKGTAQHLDNVNLGKRGPPTAKPTAMLQDALLDLPNRGDVVLDPFLGSGSTLIARQTRRTGLPRRRA